MCLPRADEMKLRPFGSFSFHKGFELLSPQKQSCAQAEGHSTDTEQKRMLPWRELIQPRREEGRLEAHRGNREFPDGHTTGFTVVLENYLKT